MILINKTNLFQRIIGKRVRPWRDIAVPDDTVFDPAIFKIFGENESKEDVENKDIESKDSEKEEKVIGDLNGDGKFDKKDKSIAGKVLKQKIKTGE